MKINIYVGKDSRFPLVSDIAGISILDNVPINYRHTICINQLDLARLIKFQKYKHNPNRFSSTEFTYTRFLIPYLEGYDGIAIFVDNDILCLRDITDLITQIDHLYRNGEDWPALIVRKHNVAQSAEGEQKMYGVLQTSYPRKNWSSFMIMNCEKLGLWSKANVENWTGAQLHQFDGIPEEEIVDVETIQSGWNDLTYPKSDTKLLHYTEGGPWFEKYRTCPGAQLWLDKFKEYFGRDYYV